MYIRLLLQRTGTPLGRAARCEPCTSAQNSSQIHYNQKGIDWLWGQFRLLVGKVALKMQFRQEVRWVRMYLFSVNIGDKVQISAEPPPPQSLGSLGKSHPQQIQPHL